MYYKSLNENVTDAKTPDLFLLFPVCNTFVGEVVTLSPTVSETFLRKINCVRTGAIAHTERPVEGGSGHCTIIGLT